MRKAGSSRRRYFPLARAIPIVEVEAPYGYVLNSDPVFFDVTPENAVSEDGIVLVIAEKENAPQKGTITIEKTGEVFSSVEIQEGKLQDRYKPIYAESGLEGAEFEIRAAEDITTPDGTPPLQRRRGCGYPDYFGGWYYYQHGTVPGQIRNRGNQSALWYGAE